MAFKSILLQAIQLKYQTLSMLNLVNSSSKPDKTYPFLIAFFKQFNECTEISLSFLFIRI